MKNLKQFGSIMMLSILISLEALAASNIDTTDKYAWSENSGWLNFNDTNSGGVTVYSDHLEGYVWAENVGLIRLGTHTSGGTHNYANSSDTDYGVNNNSGTLEGYAWSENVGWIKFDDSNGDVTIDAATGDFDGYAWAENVGWIHFKNTSPAYKVRINKADQTITFTAPATKTYGDAAFDLTATATSGDSVTFTSSTTSVCTVSGSTVTIVSVGTCTIAADQAGTMLYNAATQVTKDITINKTDQTITFTPPATKTYGDAAFDLTATATSSDSVTFTSSTTSVCTVSGSTVTIVSVGTCTIAADQAGNTNYNAATQVSQNITINTADQTITFNPPATKTYGDAAFALSATGGDSGNSVTFASSTTSVCTVSGSTVTIVSVGTCTIAADQAGNTNYNAATQVSQNITINTADQTITFTTPATKTYGDAAFALSATGGDSGNSVTFASSTTSVCTVSGSNVTIVGAGTCTIAADQTGNTNYNAATQVSQNITINKADTTTTINSDNNDPSVIGQSITVDVTVSSTTSATPTGTVTVDDGNGNTCDITLNNGTGNCALTPANGNTTLTATYNANNNFNGSSNTEQHASLTAGIQIDDGDGVNIAESGTTDTYTLAAITVPANAITLTITANAQTQISTDGINFAETANLTITDLTIHTITVKAIDDTDVEGNHTAQISHAITAGDNGDYSTNLNISNVEANIIDNEPAVIISQTNSNTQVTEDGATDTFELMLNTQPTNDVTISLSLDSQITVDLDTLTFTDSNWNTPQTVTVSVVDDNTVEYSHSSTINLSASSEDLNYDQEAAIFVVDSTVATSLSVNITDNDLPLVELSVNANSGTETDTTAITVTATASSAVFGDQSLNLAVTGINDSDYSLSGTVINIANEQTTGTVTFTIVDDNEIEGTETATLTISNSTTGIILGTTTQDIEIINNDFPSVELSVNANSGTETDTTAITVTATASSAVFGDQSLNLAVTGVNDSDYSLSGTVINIANEQTTGTVTFTIVDDNEIEDTETATLTISNPTTGIIFGTTTTQDIEIINNDFPPPPRPSQPTTQQPPEPTTQQPPEPTNKDVNIKPDVLVDGGTVEGEIKNEGTLKDVTLAKDTKIEGGQIQGKIKGNPEKPAVLINVKIIAKAELSNVILDKTVELPNDVTLKDVELRGSSVNGGKLEGTIRTTNSATVIKNVSLGENTNIIGGKLAGTISGTPKKPAVLQHLTIEPKTTLTAVIISDGVEMPTDVSLANGVRFTTTENIPTDVDLTQTLPKKGQAVDLSADPIINGLGLLAKINLLPVIATIGNIKQLNTGFLTLKIETQFFAVIPMKVRYVKTKTRASTDTQVKLGVGQRVYFTTLDGMEVTANPAVQDLKLLKTALAKLNLPTFKITEEGNIKIPATETTWFSARPDLASTIVDKDTQKGFVTKEDGNVALIFEDEKGEKREQILYPSPAYMSALGKFDLTPKGILEFEIKGQKFKGRLDYKVEQGKTTSEAIKVTEIPSNGDFMITDYPDGAEQILFGLAE